MKFINFIVIKLSGCLAAGIIASHYFPSLSSIILKMGLPGLALLLIVWRWERRKLQPGPWFGLLTYFLFFVIGYVSYQIRNPDYQKNHYSHSEIPVISTTLQVKIREVLKPDRSRNKYIVELVQLDKKKVSGRLLFTVPKNAPHKNFTVDDLAWVYSEIKNVPAPLNPFQFNYKDYLRKMGVHHQVNLTSTQILDVTKGDPTLRGMSEKLRNQVIDHLNGTPIETDQKAILQALLLGQKKDISRELYAEYAAAGALHILAVSGLHVGILYLILSWLLGPLNRFRSGRSLRSVVLVLLLWGFAMIAGLSPSVVRAVTMFSFFALAGWFRRSTHSFNTLFLSFLVLLIFRPQWLFHVGFQLSYLAVFFILWIQPRLYKYYRPRNFFDKLFWSITTVTLAAQIGVAPLSLYYFHQFPGLFFVSNLVILPFLTLILASGLIVILLAVCDLLPHTIAVSYNWIIEQLNSFIGWVARQEAFLWEDVSFSHSLLLGTYIAICTTILWWQHRKITRLLYVLTAFTLCFGIRTANLKTAKQEELILFHRTGATLMGHQMDRQLTLFQGDDLDYSDEFPIKDYRIGRTVSGFASEKIPVSFRHNGNQILLIDSTAVYPSVKTEMVILTQSPKVHLERLIDSLQPILIIADGSNYHSYVDRWRTTCQQQKLPFYHTGERGAYIFE